MIFWKCLDCGTWWSGLVHRCQPPVDSTGTFVIALDPPFPGSSNTTLPPWCGICRGWHVPGMGPCTRTYS
jgi:hypothetical protein